MFELARLRPGNRECASIRAKAGRAATRQDRRWVPAAGFGLLAQGPAAIRTRIRAYGRNARP